MKPETGKLKPETSTRIEAPDRILLSGLRSPASGLKSQVSSLSSAFSLIELLVVIAIFALMATLTLPAISSINQAGGINRAGQILGDQIILARQEATSKNRDVEVRIIDVSDPMWPGYRAIQLWLVDESGTPQGPLGKIQKLPEAIVIASNSLSPLLTADTNVSGTTNFGGLGSRPYNGFRVRASGSLPSAVTANNNFLTVQLAKDTDIPPKNYYTVRVNPVTGRVTIHRP
jgi:uncharacterized protein (TIGR02596 family)